jgi:hypothetical protein
MSNLAQFILIITAVVGLIYIGMGLNKLEGSTRNVGAALIIIGSGIFSLSIIFIVPSRTNHFTILGLIAFTIAFILSAIFLWSSIESNWREIISIGAGLLTMVSVIAVIASTSAEYRDAPLYSLKLPEVMQTIINIQNKFLLGTGVMIIFIGSVFKQFRKVLGSMVILAIWLLILSAVLENATLLGEVLKFFIVSMSLRQTCMYMNEKEVASNRFAKAFGEIAQYMVLSALVVVTVRIIVGTYLS